ncbi:unnamed protein product, partial [Urochloa humidicola]
HAPRQPDPFQLARHLPALSPVPICSAPLPPTARCHPFPPRYLLPSEISRAASGLPQPRDCRSDAAHVEVGARPPEFAAAPIGHGQPRIRFPNLAAAPPLPPEPSAPAAKPHHSIQIQGGVGPAGVTRDGGDLDGRPKWRGGVDIKSGRHRGEARETFGGGSVLCVCINSPPAVLNSIVNTVKGSRLTAFELVHDKIPAKLIADSAAAALMKQGHVQAVIVGADCIAANGDTANKIGTYNLAISAKHHGVQFYVPAPVTSNDLALPSGEEIVIEERSPKE